MMPRPYARLDPIAEYLNSPPEGLTGGRLGEMIREIGDGDREPANRLLAAADMCIERACQPGPEQLPEHFIGKAGSFLAMVLKRYSPSATMPAQVIAARLRLAQLPQWLAASGRYYEGTRPNYTNLQAAYVDAVEHIKLDGLPAVHPAAQEVNRFVPVLLTARTAAFNGAPGTARTGLVREQMRGQHVALMLNSDPEAYMDPIPTDWVAPPQLSGAELLDIAYAIDKEDEAVIRLDPANQAALPEASAWLNSRAAKLGIAAVSLDGLVRQHEPQIAT